ncbi:MAG TPA: MFS transporter [Bacteroidetes bacterium]|nr:MFS transporter [Bacteroidota bacterium]
MENKGSAENQKQLLGHPVGLFVLFFTEMWERFSYYGMRILLVLFLTSKLIDGGWEWSRKEAMILFGWYVMLIYIMPLMGGWVADNKWGHVKTVIVGAIVITLGHVSLAIADLPVQIDLKFFFYIGLLLLVIGTGFFKPNMSSIISKMYPPGSSKRDGAYTIFYMGVNAGAFIGTMLVGWLGEQISWSMGFGLAGIFMLFGLLQFYFARNIFGEEASKPQPKVQDLSEEDLKNRVPFTKRDNIISLTGGFFGIVWIIDGLFAVVTRGRHFLTENLFDISLSDHTFTIGLTNIFFILSILIFIALGISRVVRYKKVEKDRIIVIFIIAFFVVFFWASFEQAGTSMTIFARDYTNRALSGSWEIIFQMVDILLSVSPLLILTWIIYKLATKIVKEYPLTILFTTLSFTIIWLIAIFRLWHKYSGSNVEVDASWFQVLNPFFIITLAPLFSKLWEKTNIPGPLKFAMGLTLLAMGFGFLSLGATGIEKGASTASVSMIWLILAYLLHTMGELSLSPVGLSYVSKLAPARMIAFMFGIWYVFTAMAGKLAGTMASYMDDVSESVGLSGFFLIFTIVPVLAALILVVFRKKILKMMHGIE